MSGTDIWADLGIAPTDDGAAIRRAYASRLKRGRPDDDPQAFARLRAAYEAALRVAEPAAARVDARAREPVQLGRPSPTPAGPPGSNPMEDCLRRGDVLAAADWLIAARVRGELSLDRDLGHADRLGWIMAQDGALPADAVFEAVRRMGWMPRLPPAPWAPELRRRVEAEAWLSGLRRLSAKRRLDGERTAARLMLGRGRLRTWPPWIPTIHLKQRYGEYLLHAPVISGAFDADRIGAIERMVAPEARPPRMARWKLAIGAVFAAPVAGGVVGALLPGVPGIGVIVHLSSLAAMLFWIFNRTWLATVIGSGARVRRVTR